MLAVPLSSLAAGNFEGIYLHAQLLHIYNIAALFTTCVCFKELLFPKHYDDRTVWEYNYFPFQLFNFLFVTLFFVLSIHFLIHHKAYYQGYENLGDAECIRKYFLGDGLFSALQWFIASSLVVNVIYIPTHVRDYYLSGN